MRGLLYKGFQEIWFPTLAFGLALMLVKALLTYILPQALEGMTEFFDQVPVVVDGFVHDLDEVRCFEGAVGTHWSLSRCCIQKSTVSS